jgi:hypothetical protein
MNNFDKQGLKTLRMDIDSALREVATKHGINLSIGSISFSNDKFTTRLTGLTKTSVLKKATVTPSIFESAGFKMGDTFKHRTKTLQIVGYSASRPKNCVELVDQNGKKFSGSIQMVQLAMGLPLTSPSKYNFTR